MGFWKTERGIGGDGWADEMGGCMRNLEKMVKPSNDELIKDHEITVAEFADLVEFCTRGHLIVDVRYPNKDSKRQLSMLFKDNAVETYPNRGQIHCPEMCEA